MFARLHVLIFDVFRHTVTMGGVGDDGRKVSAFSMFMINKKKNPMFLLQLFFSHFQFYILISQPPNYTTSSPPFDNMLTLSHVCNACN
jgi:hypothetical protein